MVEPNVKEGKGGLRPTIIILDCEIFVPSKGTVRSG